MTEEKLRRLIKISNDLELDKAYMDYKKKLEKIKNVLFEQVVLHFDDFRESTCTCNGESNYFSIDDFEIILTPDEYNFIAEWKRGYPYERCKKTN